MVATNVEYSQRSLALKERRPQKKIWESQGKIFLNVGFPKFIGWNDRACREREHEDDFEDAKLGD